MYEVHPTECLSFSTMEQAPPSGEIAASFRGSAGKILHFRLDRILCPSQMVISVDINSNCSQLLRTRSLFSDEWLSKSPVHELRFDKCPGVKEAPT